MLTSDHTPSLIRLGKQTDILGGSPVWHEGHQALHWVDIRLPALRRFDSASGHVDTWPMSDLIGSIAFCDDDRIIVALPEQIAVFDPDTGTLEPIAREEVHWPDHRFNDGRCDRQGRFWVGTMHNVTRAPEGVLYCLDGRCRLRPMARGICIPNSLA
jgi:sugar lactone lactonase YvrE